jgi:MOSC domain-containing protein YiiM
MRIVSVNVGLPRTILWKGRLVETGIFKEPVEGRCMVKQLNLEGDRQADLTVHGGLNKAVYAYPIEHYDFWRDFLAETDLPPGAFGENLTVEGLTEESVHIGDRLQIGTTELVVTQPRQPCYKLAAKFGRTDIVRHFLESGYSGFYLAVRRSGDVGRGDTIKVIEREVHQVRVADMNRLQRGETEDVDLMQRAIQIEALPEEWRDSLREFVAQN